MTNTSKQNEQALRNFDLTDYRTIFADLVVHLYDEILKRIKAKLLPMISKIDENETILYALF